MRAVFDNRDRVPLPGLFVRLRVLIEDIQDARVVPVSAIGTDADAAQILVQNRVNAATAQLPTSVQSQGVILLFLQGWRAMLVPATTVPVTIIGAFAAMAAFGFTINMSTLFALVLAIGIVVDDAIVIVEGAARHMSDGPSAPNAAERAMQDLFGPIVGITLVLILVFLPAAFLPGLTGRLYQQFALVIAATAVISAINAVTLKPVQAALWMRPIKPVAARNRIFRAFDGGFGRLEAGYAALLARAVGARHAVAVATPSVRR